MKNKKSGTKSLQRGLLVLSSAAVLAALSNYAVPAQSAFAATTEAGQPTGSVEASTQVGDRNTDFINLLLQRNVQSMLFSAAAESERDFGDVLASIRSGRSLTEATGEKADTLREAVLDDFAHTLELEVNNGTISRSQAERARQAAADLVDRAMTAPWNDAMSAIVVEGSGERIVHRRIANIARDAAHWAKLGTADVRGALRDGYSLIEAAVPNPESSDSDDDDVKELHERMTLPEYLADLLEQDIDASVSAGRLNSEEAATLKETGVAEIARILSTPGYEPEATAWMEMYGERIVNDRIESVRFDTAALSDEDYGDALAALERGESLASVADMKEDELLKALVAKADHAIEAAWRDGALTAALAEKLKQEAAEGLTAVVDSADEPAVTTSTAEGDAAIAEASIRNIVEQSANFGEEDMTAAELRSAMQAGRTIVQAIEEEHEGSLLSSLEWNAERYIDGEVAAGRLAPEAAEPTKSMARERLAKAISTPGYVPKVDAEAYAKERLDRVLEEAAASAVRDEVKLTVDELLRQLAQGRSIAEVVGMEEDALMYELASAVNRELVAFVANGSMTAEESEQALSMYMSGLRDLLAK